MSNKYLTPSIAVIDGCGANITSIMYALQRLGVDAKLTTSQQVILSASHVILPGVGTASHAIQQLQRYRLVDTIRHLSQPFLGICLGMQLLYEFSHEGDVECLAIIPGAVTKFQSLTNIDNVSAKSIRIPHMGWNSINHNTDYHLLSHVPTQSYVYFVHSYMAMINQYSLATCHYGVPFTAIVQKDNFYGMQFHPEMSSKIGMQLLQNFVTI
jgi:imidazole glycerol-phosphate synthase subunit HisH